MTGGLVGSEIAAIAKDCKKISLGGIGQLGVGTGGRAEMARVAGPVLGPLENVQQMTLRYPCADLPLELRQAFGLNARGQLLQMRRSVSIDAQFAVRGITGVNLFGDTGEVGLTVFDKVHAPSGKSDA